MKHAIRILIALLLCLCICTALADTYYVKSGTPLSLRDENTNEVQTTIPAGTALEPVGDKCTDLCAYVTYNGYSGLVLWNYLTRTPPDRSAAPAPATEQTAPAAEQPTPAAEQPTAAAQPVSAAMTLKAVNAVIRTANKSNKA